MDWGAVPIGSKWRRPSGCGFRRRRPVGFRACVQPPVGSWSVGAGSVPISNLPSKLQWRRHSEASQLWVPCERRPYERPPQRDRSVAVAASPGSNLPASARSKSMSQRASSTSHAGHGWPIYGPVPLIPCPNCHVKLVRRTTKTSDIGNVGRDFVKCDNKIMTTKGAKKCGFFMWIDEYVDKLKMEGLLGMYVDPIASDATHEEEEAAKTRVDVHANWDIIVCELKKLNEILGKNSCSIYVFIFGMSMLFLVMRKK